MFANQIFWHWQICYNAFVKMEHRSEEDIAREGDSERNARKEEEERLAASDINWGVTILGNSIRNNRRFNWYFKNIERDIDG